MKGLLNKYSKAAQTNLREAGGGGWGGTQLWRVHFGKRMGQRYSPSELSYLLVLSLCNYLEFGYLMDFFLGCTREWIVAMKANWLRSNVQLPWLLDLSHLHTFPDSLSPVYSSCLWHWPINLSPGWRMLDKDKLRTFTEDVHQQELLT